MRLCDVVIEYIIISDVVIEYIIISDEVITGTGSAHR